MQLNSKYLRAFERIRKEMGDSFVLRDDILMVERIPQPEKKSKGGLIIPDVEQLMGKKMHSMSEDYPTLSLVLHCEPEYFCRKELRVVPSKHNPGDIIYTPRWSIEWHEIFAAMDFGDGDLNNIGKVLRSEAQYIWRGPGAYEQAFTIINEELSSPR